MRLFFDEDTGAGVAQALSLVDVSTTWVGPRQPIRKQTPDETWIPVAGKQGWLVLSANRAILQTDAERELWIEHKVGGVFLASGRIRAVDLLRLVLRKLSWLELIDADEARPFAFVLPLVGRPRRVDTIRA